MTGLQGYGIVHECRRLLSLNLPCLPFPVHCPLQHSKRLWASLRAVCEPMTNDGSTLALRSNHNCTVLQPAQILNSPSLRGVGFNLDSVNIGTNESATFSLKHKHPIYKVLKTRTVHIKSPRGYNLAGSGPSHS